MKHKYLFFLILFLAFFLRTYKLTSAPPSLDWDEVSLGYNAYSLLETGKDEFGNSWPLSIRSFNDYKPPLYVYLSLPFIALGGLNEWTVRLPSALSGVVAVAIMYWLVRNIFHSHKHRDMLALFAMGVMALSPWNLQFSRGAFEANVALTGYLIAIASFVQWLVYTKNEKSWIWLVLSAIAASSTLYAYHSARVVVPLFFIGAALLYWKKLRINWKKLIIPLLLGTALVTPLLIILLRGSAAERFNTVSIFTSTDENSTEAERINRFETFSDTGLILDRLFFNHKTAILLAISRNYFDHFNFDFLFLTGDHSDRHTASGMGVLYLIEIIPCIVGAYVLAKYHKKGETHLVVWLVLLVGPAASALTTSTPHAIRSMLILPALIILISLGWFELWQRLGYQKGKNILRSLLVLLLTTNLIYYFNSYYIVYPHKHAEAWQYGYKTLVSELSNIEKNYSKIIVTNYYDQPHIFFAFYKQIPPSEYQQFAETAHSGFGPYQFKRIEYNKDSTFPNTLIVSEPKATPSGVKILKEITFPNGEVAFNIIEP